MEEKIRKKPILATPDGGKSLRRRRRVTDLRKDKGTEIKPEKKKKGNRSKERQGD